MDYVIAPPPRPALPVVDGGRFPVRRIYCVGRNYAAHAREMGADPERDPPFFFCKPGDAVLPVARSETGEFPYPPGTANCQHEVELVVAIARGGRDIAAAQACDHVFGYAVGLDMTRRDLQLALRDTGRPWELGKAFDHSAPVSALVPAVRCGHPAAGAVRLAVNGVIRQEGDLADMIWSVAETIAHLSRYFELCPGDLIFTGTPEGVGPVTRGDLLVATIEGVGELSVRVA